MDDIALLIASDRADSLPASVSRAAALAAQYLRILGVRTNFAAGKTEAILHLCGQGTRRIQRQCLLGSEYGAGPGLQICTPGEANVTLRCVSKYTHLGTLRTSSATTVMDVQHRVRLARESLHPVRRRLLCNPHFSRQEKCQFVFSLVLEHLMHNAGTWVFPHASHYNALRKGYMSLLRGCVRPICSVPCRRLDDTQVCALLGAMRPDEALACARVRTLAAASAKGHVFLKMMLQHEQAWFVTALQAVQTIAGRLKAPALLDWVTQASAADAFPSWPLAPGATTCLLRRYRQQAVAERHGLVGPAEAKARLHDRAAAAGVHYMRLPEMRVSTTPHVCAICRVTFSTPAARASHMAKCHKMPAGSSFATGTACQVCMRQFWATRRLKQHLRSSPRCADIYAGADLDFEPPVHDDTAICAPPAQLAGPRPWWATLRPTPPEPPMAASSADPPFPTNHSGLSCIPVLVQHYMRMLEMRGTAVAAQIFEQFEPTDEHAQLAKAVVAVLLGQPDTHRTVCTAQLSAEVYQGTLVYGPRAAIEAFGRALLSA